MRVTFLARMHKLTITKPTPTPTLAKKKKKSSEFVSGVGRPLAFKMRPRSQLGKLREWGKRDRALA